jgi:hypothetical protein
LSLNGTIDGGVYYFGHSGTLHVITGTNDSETTELFVGELPGSNTNITAANVFFLKPLQTGNSGNNFLGSNTSVVINGCESAKTIYDATVKGYTSIDEMLSYNLGRGVYGYEVFVHFSQVPASQDTTTFGLAGTLPDALPMYMVPDGSPRSRPGLLGCTPSGGYCSKLN